MWRIDPDKLPNLHWFLEDYLAHAAGEENDMKQKTWSSLITENSRNVVSCALVPGAIFLWEWGTCGSDMKDGNQHHDMGRRAEKFWRRLGAPTRVLFHHSLPSSSASSFQYLALGHTIFTSIRGNVKNKNRRSGSYRAKGLQLLPIYNYQSYVSGSLYMWGKIPLRISGCVSWG